MDFVNQEKRKQTNEEENPFENQKKIVRLSDVEIVFDNLPDDILEHVFRFLTVVERKQACLVSKRWLGVGFWYTFAKHMPLSFDPCDFFANAKPKLTFSNTQIRIFPCVRIGVIEEEEQYSFYKTDTDLVEFYKTMKKIGGGTTHLTLTDTDPPKSVMCCFPNLCKLDLCNLETFSKLHTIPTSLQTICLEQIQTSISNTLHDLIKSFSHITELRCTSILVSPDSCEPGFVQFVKFTEGLDTFLKNNTVAKELKVASPNLIKNQTIDYKHITGLIVNNGFQNYSQLHEFNNLNELAFVSSLDCVNFHSLIALPQVTTIEIKTSKHFVTKLFSLDLSDWTKIYKTNVCDICLNYILASFRHLTTFTTDRNITDDQVVKIYETTPFLKNLKIGNV